jgi:hypothetical protein
MGPSSQMPCDTVPSWWLLDSHPLLCLTSPASPPLSFQVHLHPLASGPGGTRRVVLVFMRRIGVCHAATCHATHHLRLKGYHRAQKLPATLASPMRDWQLALCPSCSLCR